MTLASLARRLSLTAVVAAAAMGAGLWSVELCGDGPTAPQVVDVVRGQGALRAGAALVEVTVPLPVELAGYSPVGRTASRLAQPLFARAVVLETGGVPLGWVTLDLLTVPDGLHDRLVRRLGPRGLSHLLVTATHTHSSLGSYDARMMAQVGGVGRYRDEVLDALTVAAARALEDAHQKLEPASLLGGLVEAQELSRARTGDSVDPRLGRLVVQGARGPLAQFVWLAAHPTLVERDARAVDTDYPGRLAAAEEKRGQGVTLVVQGAVGNASAIVGEAHGSKAEAFTARVQEAAGRVELGPLPSDRFGFARVRVGLPAADASRIAPSWLGNAGDNLLCAAAPEELELWVLELGGCRYLLAPGEVTAASAKVLERAIDGVRVVSLTNGYVGYIETPELVRTGAGESKRQYFGEALLDAVVRATEAGFRSLTP